MGTLAEYSNQSSNGGYDLIAFNTQRENDDAPEFDIGDYLQIAHNNYHTNGLHNSPNTTPQGNADRLIYNVFRKAVMDTDGEAQGNEASISSDFTDEDRADYLQRSIDYYKGDEVLGNNGTFPVNSDRRAAAMLVVNVLTVYLASIS